jgi:hypothetical protein
LNDQSNLSRLHLRIPLADSNYYRRYPGFEERVKMEYSDINSDSGNFFKKLL